MITRKQWDIGDANMDKSFKERLLSSSGMTEEALDYGLDHMYGTYNIPDMEKASQIIVDAIRNKKSICILGDYDVDGTMATIELVKFLNQMKVDVDYYIPHRLKDGYGISENAVKYVLNNHYHVVITVDNGIAEHSRIEELKNAGVCVVVTDHHECKDSLPAADAVVDLKRKDSMYPFKELCGAGIALKLIQAVASKLDNVSDDIWKEYLEYAAIATVADVVPLVEENRIIVKEGIERIKTTNKREILELLQIAKRKNMDLFKAEDIAFYVGPIINAASRVGEVDILMDFFLSDEENLGSFLSDSLVKFNEQRKKIEKEILDEAESKLLKDFDWTSTSPIVVYGKGWHRGVIGIVASRIVDKYKRSAIVLSLENGEYHGSCRNYGETSMMDMLGHASMYIKKYGGHKEAAGLTVEEKNISAFTRKIKQYPISEEQISQKDKVGMAVKISDVTIENVDFIKKLAPFGCGNPSPLFIAPSALLSHMRKIGKKDGAENAHLKTSFKDREKPTGIAAEGIGFFMSDYCSFMKPGDLVSPVFQMDENVWEGTRRPQMQLKNIVIDSPVMQHLDEDMEMNDLFLYDGIPPEEIESEYGISCIPDETEYYPVFCQMNRFMKDKKGAVVFDIPLTAMEVSVQLNMDINSFKLMRILEAVIEAGYYDGARISQSKMALIMRPGRQYKQIKQTISYQNIHKNH